MPDVPAPDPSLDPNKDSTFAPSLLDLVLGGLLALVLFFVPVVIYAAITGTLPLFGGKLTQGAVPWSAPSTSRC